jgi:hypothetical protein
MKNTAHQLTQGDSPIASISQQLSLVNTVNLAASSSAVSDRDLALYFELEQTSGTTAVDSAPDSTNNQGLLRNGATFDPTGGRFGGGVDFDGVDDYIFINRAANLTQAIQPTRTIALWFKISNRDRRQVIYDDGTSERGLNIYIDKGRLYVGGWDIPKNESNWDGTYLSTDAIAINTWHHVTLVLNAQTGVNSVQSGAFLGYLDGVKFGQGNGAQLWPRADIGIGTIRGSTVFHDGTRSGTGAYALAGSIDDVRIYNRALNADEVASLANATSTPINNVPIATNDTATTQEDTAVTLLATTLLANDSDKDGDLLSLTGVSNAVSGSVSLRNGNVVFQPSPNFKGNGSFVYTISDGRGGTASATVVVAVSPVNDAPVAVNDIVATKTGTPITLLATDLLKNDSDVDGDILSLTGVSKAMNGSVALSNGKVVFTPTASFSGNASFAYTISDGRGGIGSGTVNVTVSSTTAQGPLSIGTNLAGLVDWSTERPFLDAFKMSRPWITQSDGVFDTGEESQLNLDKDGWVKSLPAPADSPQYYRVTTTIGSIPVGKYVVSYDGEGTIEYFAAAKDAAASNLGRDVINVTSSSNVFMNITATDPKRTGNYIRNIHVVPIAYESNYATEIFNPDFIKKIEPFKTLRFMDWMETNNSTQSTWDKRPTPMTSTFQGIGASVETMVALANKTHSNPWFTLPHLATDDYVTKFAQYVKATLDPALKIYVEYSNEVWNGMFGQGTWIEQQGQKAWPNSTDSGFTKRIDWFGKRTTEIATIWDNVFGTDKDRVIGTMAAQSANTWTAQRALDYTWSSQPKSNKEYGIDAIAIAPYFGYYLGDPNNAPTIESWTKDTDGGLNKLFDELTQGGLIQNGPKGGALQDAYNSIKSYVDLAKQENLQLVAYEGGQHLVGFLGVENNQAITDLFNKANRDPRMGEIYKQYFQKWFELGGGTFANFSDVSSYSKWGSWGLLEDINQQGSSKYDAVMSLLQPATVK